MIRLLTVVLCTLFLTNDSYAEIKRWRVGDDAQPWSLRPVTGRLDLGRSWVVEIVADDDGDGVLDYEDPFPLLGSVTRTKQIPEKINLMRVSQ